LSAAVSNCEKDRTVMVDPGGKDSAPTYVDIYACDYEWTFNGVTYRQHEDGRTELEGKHATVFVDPTHPNTMVPEDMARYKELYYAAALCLFLLLLPGYQLVELQSRVAHSVRMRVDEVLVRAKRSAAETVKA